MADKSSFSADEWKLILEGVMMASVAITAAEPSGLWGVLKESFAVATSLAAAKKDAGSSSLIKAVTADFETSEGRSLPRDGLKERFAGSKQPEINAKFLDVLRQVAAVVDTKAAEDGAAFKRWLRQISQHVAEAAKEGGFLGIGGAQVSEAEEATLTEISTALAV